jgi:predicted phage tail protein
MTDKIIRGSGGPPPTPPSPTRAPDTLNSRQFATIQDLLSEGEIEGFATASKAGLTKGTTAYNNAALKDIFLNDTPILNSSASNTSPQTSDFNFQNVGFTPRFGTSNQEHIPGIESSQSTTAVGVTVTNSSPVTRQITNTNVDAVKVTITFPQLQKATDQGDLLGSSVQLKIQVQYNGGGFNDAFSPDTITGRTADAYQKEYRVNITGAFPVDIRVVRITADSTSSQLVDAFTWTSISEIIDDRQRYLNSAYTSLRIDSEQFSSIPKRAFRIRGVKVRIPAANGGLTPTVVSNQTIADSLGLGTCSSFGFIHYPENYIFNGTMTAAQWCSDPAMILLDLLTTERYGFGTHITDANLDLFSFVAASRYSTGNKGGSELISDGFGGSEPRFSCNVNLQGSMEAYTLINELAGVMRCFPIWSEGSVTITQDKPTDPSYLFSLANVGEGGFSYSGSSLKQRHTVISVSYFNMDSREIDYEVVEDTAAQAKLGIVKKDVKAFACTSRGQAQRLGKAILFSEQNESEVISFTTSIDAGAIVRPGSVISVNDPVRGGERRSGRINAATTTQITVDNTQDLDTFTGSNKKCSVILPDGTVETKNVLGIIGSVITLDSALSATPNVNAIWLLQSSTLEAQTFRVITVEEQDGINYAITALTYIDGKYDNIESGISLPSRSISLLNEPKSPPSNLKVSDQNGESKEMIVTINGLAVSKLLLTWVPVTGVSQYLVQFRFNNSNWTSEIVFRPDFEIINTEAGTYEFKVYSFNAALKLSTTSSDLTFNAVGKTAPPGNVQNLSMEPVTNKLVRLRWTKAVDPDVLHGGRVYVRHSNLTDGSGTFQNSVDLVTALAGNTTDVVVPSLEGEYILKFQDDQGNFSTGEASVIQDLPDLIDTQIILQDREDLDSPPFQGVDTNTTFNTTTSALQLSNPATNATGEYAFKDILDLGAVFSLDLKRVIRSVGFNIGTDIETIIPSGSLWDNYATDGNFDGPAADEANCQVQVATSQTASGSFGSFNNFANGTFKGRRFKFKLVLETTNTAQNMNVQQAGYTAEFQSRTEQNYQTGGSTSTAPQQSGTSSSGKTVTFGTPFFTGVSGLGGANAFLPSIGITIQDAQAGDFFTVTNVSGTGFTLKVMQNNNSTFVDRSFTFSAVGYGKGV